MKISTVSFLCSNTCYTKCPSDRKPEMALIGRSNVGKSSLINMLLGNKRLAKISSVPGKTQLINHFLVNDTWNLVDLPGYGWARASKTLQQSWEKMVKDYLLHREQLVNVFVLVDSKLTPQKIDINFINWLGENDIPFSIIFTKVDKHSIQQVENNINKFRQELAITWQHMPRIMIASSKDSTGKVEILKYINSIIKDC